MDGPAEIFAWRLGGLFVMACGVFLPVLALGSGPETPERTCLVGTGRSMLPTLPEFCRLVVMRVPLNEIKAGNQDGDIIVTRLNGRVLVHRAISHRADGSVVTRGDNNPGPDAGATTERNYVGLVLGFEKPGTVGELLAPGPRR
jgi:hypothetical protein